MILEIKKQIREYFVGKEEIVDNLLICLFAKGHVLIEDVPGVGKTTLASTLASAVDCDFGRIQFTPDTLPTDVMGTEIFNMKSGEFEYREGAIMHQIVLADEINRTSPKTQSSLLEAMAEGQTTVNGVRHKLPTPFMVVATQNPVEYIGTYPLPEAQMDRFMMRISLGYPDKEEEIRMAKNMLFGKTQEKIGSVVSSDDVLKIQEEVERVTVKDEILEYVRDIIEATRTERRFVTGASPRALLALVKASQSRAYMDERDYVKPDDVKEMAIPVLSHRLSLTSEAKLVKEDVGKVLTSILNKVKVPR